MKGSQPTFLPITLLKINQSKSRWNAAKLEPVQLDLLEMWQAPIVISITPLVYKLKRHKKKCNAMPNNIFFIREGGEMRNEEDEGEEEDLAS